MVDVDRLEHDRPRRRREPTLADRDDAPMARALAGLDEVRVLLAFGDAYRHGSAAYSWLGEP